MSLSLKHIPCPKGNDCTAFHCIFGHPNEQPSAPEVSVTRASSNDTGNKKTAANQDVSRKRVRTDPFHPAPSPGSPQNTGQSLSGTSRADSTEDIPKPVAKKLKTAGRPVSPPPLKRKVDAQNDTPYAPSKVAKTSQPTSDSRPFSVQKVASAKPKKAESLNPRLLKSSPASHDIRLKLVRMLHQELTRLNKELKKIAKKNETSLLLSDQELIVRSLDEEEYIAVHKTAVYSNVMKNKVMQYKRMKVDQWKTEREDERKKLEFEASGKDPSEKPLEIKTGLTPPQEVELAKRILTPIDKLASHGYVSVVPCEEDIEKARQGLETAAGWEKCDRCQQRFQVFPGRREEDGALTSGGKCTFHWGKTFIAPKALGDKTRQPKRYQCCGQELGDSVGCYTRDHHVFKTSDPKRLASILNFAETPENPLAPTDRAVAFDCEMGYTVYGMELIRLTATSWPTGEELLDVLVRPLGEILDLNSRYSGVWPEDLAQAESWSADTSTKPTKSGSDDVSEDGELKPKKKQLKIVSSPEVARDLLFSLIAPTTPLIGHGLENDLNSVRIVHPTLIDTVLLYPHKAGLPYRYGLKMLMDSQLNRKIQQETGPKMLGHDSAEDARAAGDLVRLKIRNLWMDMQREGWKLVGGRFVGPGKAAGSTAAFIEA
ncbi:related to REX3 - RNA exonuclease, member of the family of 3` -5` exonucleases [Fusarium torulosum]|uniref:Related to REX3 - RNA exonuclease, member of the family of 3` -5` exonucleases n=1 Tax=Fusarium torulosum TaxID=33205 RepID=A0AAE8MIX5_9HYPO|nr:related to REX3 - RNA exonuclease, member of the family of 3` -5` exonucleases [Fusarium torulosum]